MGFPFSLPECMRFRYTHPLTTLARARLQELLVLAGHLLLYPTGVFAETLPESTGSRLPTEGRSPPPVLLLHGFIDNRSVFYLLRRSLRGHGWRHVQALNYSPLTCDIRQAATQLERHIEEVCRRTGHSQVDIVGHSLGGLIARYHVQRQGGDRHVRTLVTLGTPHSGTRLAAVLPAHPIVRQMRPGSDLINELTLPAPGCRTHFVSFWSELDELMIPVETARVEHPDLIAHNVPVRGVGHLALPVHGAVAAGIRQALTGSGGPQSAVGTRESEGMSVA
jgi:pimeloyl-ACP methyl ester carboxylesterase